MADDIARALGISFRATPANDREIVFQTHVEQDISAADLNVLLDRLAASVDRQAAKAQLVETRKLLEQHEKQRRQMGEDLANVDARALEAWEATGKRGPFKLSPKDQTAKMQATANIARWDEEIAKLRTQIIDLETKAE